MSSAVGRADTTDSVCKAAIAQTGRLALRKAREAAGLVAHTSAVVGTPRIDHHGGARARTRRQREQDRQHETGYVENSH